MTSHSQPSSIPTFLSLALLTVLVMITRAMSGSWQAAIPALIVWACLACAYNGYRLAQSWHPLRRRV